MHAHRKSLSLVLGLGLLGAGTAYAKHALDSSLAGWTPMVTMWGGDEQTAVRSLSQVTQAYEAFLQNTEVDEPTQKFIDKALKEFEDFDLAGFHDLLPDERGERRELNVKGGLAGNRYLVTRADPNSRYEVGVNGPRNGLADMSLLIHAQQKKSEDHKSLIVGTRIGLGLGPLSYRGLMDAERDLARLATTGDPTGSGVKLAPSAKARARVTETNPGLGPEDIETLAILYDAYPALGEALTGVGRLEDVRAATAKGGYYHITTRMRAEPDRLKEKYPNFAKHIKKLGDVLHATVRVLDDKGRDIVRLTVDSEKLLFGVESYINQDGLPLPFDNKRVYEDEPLDPVSDALQHPRVLVNARLNMLGIIINARNLRLDARYRANDGYATADARMTTVPDLKVEGRALGIFAPGFLDLFIPGNIEDTTRKFFEVAAKGNGGKGLRAHVELGARTPGAPGVFSLTAQVEALESFIIKMGGGIITDRLMMNKKAEKEAKQLAADLHEAFKRDFNRFRKQVGGSG